MSRDADRRALLIAFVLITGFMIGEAIAGLIAHSLALLADSAHMLTDAAALGLGLVAITLAARPAKGAATFGLKRSEILSAQFNGATLLVLALLIIFEAVARLISPPQVHGQLVLYVALAGIAVNLAATWTLAKANRQSLNIEGSFQHILTDLFAFIATAIAAIVIITTGFVQADAIASLLVAALMLRAAYGLLRDSGRVFLEMAPKGLDPAEIGQTLVSYPGARDNVHDLPRLGDHFGHAVSVRPRRCARRHRLPRHSTRRSPPCSKSGSESNTPPCKSTTAPATGSTRSSQPALPNRRPRCFPPEIRRRA